MKRLIQGLGIALFALVLAATTAPTHLQALVGGNTCTLANSTEAEQGFDAFGYNRCAGIFDGPADGMDKSMDGTIYGDPTWANDHLKMKWNKAWDRCNAVRTPENCAGAWIDNQWNGMAGGSGETWHYKIVWVGSCDELPEDTYCIWNEYMVTFSHGTVANAHFWDTHASPNGFGSF
jgi:hypothetical protein